MAPPEGCFDREVGVASADRLPIREFSLLRSLAPALASYDGATELERGLDILLTGLTDLLTPSAAAQAAVGTVPVDDLQRGR
jgi:threonine/homoserine efflux transporter RhtA